MIRILKAFLPAVVLTFLLASIFSTQANLAQVQAMGLDVDWATRLSTTVQDIVGMASSYLLLIAIAFAVALPVASWLARRFPAMRGLLFALAGFTAIAALHLALQSALGIHVIAATRSMSGFLWQCLAGVAGAYLYYRLIRANPATQVISSH